MARNERDAVAMLQQFHPDGGNWDLFLKSMRELGELVRLPPVAEQAIAIFRRDESDSFTLEALAELNDMEVDDGVILAAHAQLRHSRNGPTQAYSYWGALGVISARRPNLFERLLRLPMDRIYWYWDATDVDAVLDVVNGSKGLMAAERLQQACFDPCRAWLRKELPKRREPINRELQSLLDTA